MSKVIDDFIKSVKDKKIEQLMSIALDLAYWRDAIKDLDADVLRKELGEEQQKLVKSAKGSVINDSRNIERINEITQQIDLVEKASAEIAKLEDMDKNIRIYMAFVQKPTKELMSKYEDIVKM